MKPIWTVGYSDTHEPLFSRHFLPSFVACGLQNAYELRVRHVEWNRVYGESEFNSGYREEVRRMADEFERNPDRLIVCSGCDIHLYSPKIPELIEKALSDGVELASMVDGVATWGGHPGANYCTCLFAARSTPAIRDFFSRWLADQDIDEMQNRYNTALGAGTFKFSGLPSTFWTHGLATGAAWDGASLDSIPDPPPGIVSHHGNWTVGATNKMALLNEIERRVMARG